MNRWIALLNLICLLLLLSLLGHDLVSRLPAPQVDPPEPEQLPMPAVSLLGGADERHRVLLRFAEAMVSPEQVGDILDSSCLAFEPRCRGYAEWLDERSLCFVPLEDLEAARRYHLALDPELCDAMGRVLGERPALLVDTGPLRFLSAVPTTATSSGLQAICLRFNAPVAAADLATHCRIGEDLELLGCDGQARQEWTLQVASQADALSLHISQELAAMGGGQLSRDIERDIRFRDAFQVQSAWARSESIRVECSSDIDAFDPSTLRIEPPVTLRHSRYRQHLTLRGQLQPGQLYTLHLSADFPGQGQRIGSARTMSLRIPPARPRLKLPGTGSLLSRLALPQLPFEACNVERMELRVQPVYGNNLVELARCAWRPDHLLAPGWREQRTLAIEHDQTLKSHIDLRSLVDTQDLPAGVYQLRLRDCDGRAWSPRQLVQISDLALGVRCVGDSLLAAPRSLAGGQPLSGTKVSVLSASNQLLAEGLSDEQGLALLELAGHPEDREPFLVLAEHGEDRGYVDEDSFRSPALSTAGGAPPTGPEELEAWLHAERGVARPGEELRVLALIRDGLGRVPVGRELLARWRRPDGQVHHQEGLRVSTSGLHLLRLPGSRAMPTGPWQLRLIEVDRYGEETCIGETTERVDAIVPLRLEGALRLPEQLMQGESAELGCTGRWLSGEAAADTELHWQRHWRCWDYRPKSPAFQAFSFAAEDHKRRDPGAERVVEAALDAAGQAQLLLLPPKDPGSCNLELHLRAELIDPSGRAVPIVGKLPVLRPRQLGVRLERAADGQLAIQACCLNPLSENTSSAEGRISLQLQRRHWSWDWDSGMRRWRSRQEREVLHETELDWSDSGSALWHCPEAEGWLVAVASWQGQRAEQALGAVPAPDRLRLQAERGPEGLSIALDAPFAGLLVLSLEGRRCHSASSHSVSAGHQKLHLALPETTENLHLVAQLSRGQREHCGEALWIQGHCRVPAPEQPPAQLSLSCPAEALPGSSIPVDIQLPGAQRAIIALVDVGVLSLTAHAPPEPRAWFSRPRRLEAWGMDSCHSLFDNVRYAEETGGDDLISGADLLLERLQRGLSDSLRCLALCQECPLDATGQGRCSFQLPDDFEGRLRLIAVAAGSSCFAAAHLDLAVRADWGLRLAGPRLLAPGDTTQLTCTLSNRTASAQTIELRHQFSGALDTSAKAEQLNLAAGATHSLSLPCQAGPAGSLQLSAAIWLDQQSQRQVELSIPIREAAIIEHSDILTLVEGSWTWHSDGSWAEGSRLRLSADARPAAAIAPLLEALVRYPHGCAEQTSSRGRACLAAEPLLTLLDHPLAADARAHCAEALRRIQGLLREDGIGLWPGSNTADPFVTLACTRLLLDAEDAGLLAPPGLRQRLLDAVRDQSAADADLPRRCLAAWLLARARTPQRALLDQLEQCCILADADSGQSPLARAWLARARLANGQRSAARRVLDAVDTSAPWAGSDVYASPLRDRAELLDAWLHCAPAALPQPLLQEILSAAQRVDQLSTQEQAAIVEALGSWLRSQAQGEPGSFQFTATRAGQLIASSSDTLELPLSRDLTLSIHSQGSFLARLAIHGPRSATQRQGCCRLKRQLLDADRDEPATLPLQRGHRYRYRSQISSGRQIQQFLLCSRLPAGCELTDQDSFTCTDGQRSIPISHIERADDRLILVIDQLPPGNWQIDHQIRAVSPGSYQIPPLSAEALYEPGSLSVLGDSGNCRIAP